MNAAASAEVLELIQLLRATSYEDLELLWKQLSGNVEYRYLLAFHADQEINPASCGGNHQQLCLNVFIYQHLSEISHYDLCKLCPKLLKWRKAQCSS